MTTETNLWTGSSISGIGRSISGWHMKLGTLVSSGPASILLTGNNILGDALQHTARLEDKCWENDSAEVGARSQLGDDVHQDCMQESLWSGSSSGRGGESLDSPFP